MLECSINSVLELDVDLELVIVDDGSTDNTFTFLQDMIKRLRSVGDKRVTLLKPRGNHGQAVALNRALAVARGEYIWQWSVRAMAHPDAVQLVKLLDDSKAGFVYGCMFSYGGRKDYVHRPPRVFDMRRFARRYHCNWYMFRRIPGIAYEEYMTTPEGQTIGVCDRDMVMQLMDKGQCGYALHDVTAVLYYNGGKHTMHKVKEYQAEIDNAFNERWGHML
jgi:glycosyltransferase involved in cell wall biosynthesis